MKGSGSEASQATEVAQPKERSASHCELHFLLVGNGPYANRGCEAIVRGTMAILRKQFGAAITATVCTYGPPEVAAQQAAAEVDPGISHLPLTFRRWSVQWVLGQIAKRVSPRFPPFWSGLTPALARSCVALQVGGDNYSLDYGSPYRFIALDHLIWFHRVPVCLWGASIGPFDADPAVARAMLPHLERSKALFIRESASFEYLCSHGIRSNVFRVSDPAFAMEGAIPTARRTGLAIPPHVVGLNFSALMAKYLTQGDVQLLVNRCADIVACVASRTRRPVLLVPHVFSRKYQRDDRWLLSRIAVSASSRTCQKVLCLESDLTAAEIKGVISQCDAFAGARMHATIASLSSFVPTLSFAYSAKSRGLNQDVFGCLEFCLEPDQLKPDVVAAGIADLLANREGIQRHLRYRIPQITDEAYSAGRPLQDVIDGGKSAGAQL